MIYSKQDMWKSHQSPHSHAYVQHVTHKLLKKFDRYGGTSYYGFLFSYLTSPSIILLEISCISNNTDHHVSFRAFKILSTYSHTHLIAFYQPNKMTLLGDLAPSSSSSFSSFSSSFSSSPASPSLFSNPHQKHHRNHPNLPHPSPRTPPKNLHLPLRLQLHDLNQYTPFPPGAYEPISTMVLWA